MPTREPAKSQNPQDITLSVNRKEINGIVSGNWFECTPNGDKTMIEVGGDGSVVFSDIPDSYFTVKVTVLPTSDANDIFQDALDSRKFFPFDARDVLGRMVCTSPTAKIKTQPAIKFADKVQGNEWTLICTYGKYAVRGSKASV